MIDRFTCSYKTNAGPLDEFSIRYEIPRASSLWTRKESVRRKERRVALACNRKREKISALLFAKAISFLASQRRIISFRLRLHAKNSVNVHALRSPSYQQRGKKRRSRSRTGTSRINRFMEAEIIFWGRFSSNTGETNDRALATNEKANIVGQRRGLFRSCSVRDNLPQRFTYVRTRCRSKVTGHFYLSCLVLVVNYAHILCNTICENIM